MRKIRVAVAGLGVGRQHAAAFKQLDEHYTLAAVCDANLAAAQAAAAEWGVPRAVAGLSELCALDDVDLIDLCTPSGMHYAQTLEALAAGKDVIVEKPAAGSLREIDALLAAQECSGRRIMPIFQYRFWNGVQKLKYLSALGLTGRAYLTSVETCWRRGPEYYATWHGKWQSEMGGPLVTLAVHAHDILTYVLGPARSVFARAKTLVNPIETEDTASASLEMADGSLASLSVTTGSARQITRHRFCFSRMTAESNTEAYRSTADPWSFSGDTPELDAEIHQALENFIPLREGFAGQFEGYARAMAQGTPPPVTLQDARVSLELMTALYDSIFSGRAVSLPLTPTHRFYGGWAEYAAGRRL